MSKTVTLSDGSVWEYGTVEHPMGDGMAWRYRGPTDEFSRDSVQTQPFLVTARYDGLTASDHRAIADVLAPAPVAGEAGTVITREQVEIVARVMEWQAAEWVHPLTCGNDSHHRKLVPLLVGGDVGLMCADCDYVQRRVPLVCIAGPGKNPLAALSAPHAGQTK